MMGKVPCKRTRRAACPLSNAIYQHAPQVLEEDELNASVLTDSVRRCIKISITSARIRSRAGYGLRTFFSQSLVRSIDEDMAVREGLSVSESSDRYRGLWSRSGFLNAVLADQFVILLPSFISHITKRQYSYDDRLGRLFRVERTGAVRSTTRYFTYQGQRCRTNRKE